MECLWFFLRDGVSESQFNQVLNIELDQMIKGTSRPAHYHVLLDEIGFSPDNLQNLILTLSYMFCFWFWCYTVYTSSIFGVTHVVTHVLFELYLYNNNINRLCFVFLVLLEF